MDTTQPVIVVENLPLETQVVCAQIGAGAATLCIAPFVALLLIRRAFKAGEGRFDD